ncbi:MAG: UDP-N-acetylmuramoyl-tripeptide--D-alanyl-D-alanine ligase [Rickettsia endosymbiont of Pentastiridius leporinus]
MIWNSETLSKALGITIASSITANEIQFNSNDVKKGDLFIALKGNRDGHDYVHDAINKGAAAAIVSKQIDISDKEKTILVNDCFEALEKLALYKRKNSKAKFIAITGSVGKTSTKEALKTLLQHNSKIFAGRGNFNNHLGLLINLASMRDDTEFAIFELGMNHKGEIRELTKILKPNIAMITNISEAHLEFFNSLEEIAEAKCEIFESFSKNDIAVINADTNCYDKILSILKNLSVNNIYKFGKSPETSAQLILYENLEDQVHLKYDVGDKIIDINLPFIPKHFAENYAAVLLILSLLNKDLNKAAHHLADVTPTKGRGEIINIKNCRIICDYYNASPASMKAALEYLKQLPAVNKTAIIGEMLELGQNSERLHTELIPYILNSSCSKVFLIGTHTKYIYDLLPSSIIKMYFENVYELITETKDLFENKELVLIKGSRGIKLNKIIDYYSKVN